MMEIGPIRMRLCWLNRFRRWIRRLSRPSGVPLPSTHRSFTVPVLVIRYFPVKNGRIDVNVTGDVDAPLEDIRRRTVEATERVVQALETGSTYHGYKLPDRGHHRISGAAAHLS
jgi:hypothetical protein